MNSKQKLQGFSLVELMIALTLSAFLIGSVSLMYLSTRSTTLDAEALSRIQENVRFATDYLIRDIRNAGFDDVAELEVDDVKKVKDAYVDVKDGSEISIRYAGRGHCAERFDDFEVVQNTYTVSADGSLTCTGEVLESGSWGSPATVNLVSGLSDVTFEVICQNSGACGPSCTKGSENPCVGVRLTLEFPGLRSMQGGQTSSRSVQLTAGLRNSVMRVLYDDAIAQQGAE